MQRRAFLETIATAAMPAMAADARRPNIVIIYCDDLGYGDLGCYGSRIRTPHIDSLAAHGIRFTNFYSGNPVCSPSRAALLTGRYCVRAGVPKVLFPVDEKGLPESETTIAQTLKPKGYRTMCVGKWHLGHKEAYLPTTRGFDHYFGIPYSNDMNPRWLMDGTKVVEEQATLETLTPRYTERAIKFIEESAKANEPFFLYMPHTYPHIPLAASAKFRGKSPLGIYGDVVEELDWSVGEILAALKRSGAESNTLVIFSSDNGPWYQGSSGALRGRKGSTWEGGQRVPFLARFPGRIPRGKVSNAVAGVMDLHPTVAKLCGAEAKNPFDGIDIWPLLTAARPSLEREAFLYFDDVYAQCARLGKWKLHIARHNAMIYNPAPQAGRMSLPLASPELYDLEADPAESYDVAAENPTVVADLKARIERVIATMPEPIRQAHAAHMSRKATSPPAGSLPRPAAN
jgi:arylsulfatase A